jgi:ketosteroid isomerase-like protein
MDLIMRGYRALGMGADADVLAMFDQLGGDPSQWVVHDYIESGREYASRDVVALDLFGGIPPHFEVIGVDPERWRANEDATRIVVTGHYRTRPRGGWDVFVLPFVHIWSVAGGRIERVVSYIDGVEVERLVPGRRRGSWLSRLLARR